MGSVWSTVVECCPESLAVKVSESYNRKRKRDLADDEEIKLNSFLTSPKRRKLACTAAYIYQALYVEGKDSDITVNVLNKDWKLHKVYLGQSQYFHSMFSGSWNETNKSYITIKAEDPNITVNALNTVFGSFYKDEITVEPRLVIGVLAAATMFQLEGLIEQCCEIMLETISPLTAVKYYQAACQYGAQNVKEKIISWFTVNLTDYFAKKAVRLQDIDIDLMLTILRRPDLCIMQTEMTLYHLLRKWMYLRVYPPKDESSDGKDYKRDRDTSAGDQSCFLLTQKGKEYVDVFRELRIDHLSLHSRDNSVIIDDKIIPESWLMDAYKKHWVSLLNVSAALDKGPPRLSAEIFSKHAIRCGRVINEGDTRSWRWNWFNYGIDLIWSISDNGIFVQRHCTLCSVNHSPPTHHIMAQVEVMNLDEQRQVKRRTMSDVGWFSLTKNQEVKLLTMGEEFDYPLYISIKVLLTSPPNKPKTLDI